MPEFTPTPEQEAIVAAAVETKDNLIIEARAGAAKTSTLILIAEALPDISILSLAFNKKIADEMRERLPDNCDSMTLNGLGHRAWYQFLRKRLRVDARKNYGLLREAIDDLTDDDDKDEAWEFFAETLKAIGMSKQEGYLPDDFKGHWKPLCGDDEFFATLEFEPSDLQIDLIRRVSQASFMQALEGYIDFDDQILCPAVCSVSFPTYPLILVDEAQDLSPINHVILRKLVKINRLIAVGDPCQAIYGFRGADENSMKNLQQKFSMTTFYLTISFRCSKAVTYNAKWRAPDMQSPDWAAEGSVHRLATWDASLIEDSSAIICRNNAPLFGVAISLIKQGRLPEILGRDIAKNLEKILKSLGKPNMLQGSAIEELDRWRDKELKRVRNAGVVRDKHECLRIILAETDTLGDAIAYLKHLLSREGRILLMTGHKSKGLEFESVFFLDAFLCRIDRGQDANIKYVIETRSKGSLTYIETEGMNEYAN